MKKVFTRNEMQAFFPFIGRTQSDEYLMASLLKPATEIYHMALAAAEGFCR
jgi:hypothetical protein